MPTYTFRFITLFNMSSVVMALRLVATHCRHSPSSRGKIRTSHPNPWNNIHNQSWFNDSYRIPGPTEASRERKSRQISNFTFIDPITGPRA